MSCNLTSTTDDSMRTVRGCLFWLVAARDTVRTQSQLVKRWRKSKNKPPTPTTHPRSLVGSRVRARNGICERNLVRIALSSCSGTEWNKSAGKNGKLNRSKQGRSRSRGNPRESCTSQSQGRRRTLKFHLGEQTRRDLRLTVPLSSLQTNEVKHASK